jgi:chromosome segregation ATPase
MARVTEQDVFETADSLLARGERPTIDRVRQELGRGSPNTINPHLDSWWKGLSERVGGVQAPGLPPALVQAVTRIYEEMRRQLVGEAERLAEAQNRKLQDRQRELEQAQATLAAEKAGVLAIVDALKAELAQLREANQALTHKAAQQGSELEGARQQVAAAALQVRQANEERERTAAAGCAEAERVREQWQGNERRWLREIDHLRDEARRLRTEHDRSQKALVARNEELEQQVSSGTKERAALRQTMEASRRDLAKEREKRIFAEGALTASRKRTRPASATPQGRKAREASSLQK